MAVFPHEPGLASYIIVDAEIMMHLVVGAREHEGGHPVHKTSHQLALGKSKGNWLTQVYLENWP